ncbi:MAG: hypothetical protein WCB04_09150, partial [Mycobacteriales bacterium]
MPLPVVRWAHVSLDPDQRLALLAAAESATIARIERLHRSADRDSTLVAHALARVVAARVLGCLPNDVATSRHCPECGSTEHGRPGARGPDGARTTMSISHTSALAAAIAGASVGVGIDVEAGHPGADWRLPAVFTNAEATAIDG